MLLKLLLMGWYFFILEMIFQGLMVEIQLSTFTCPSQIASLPKRFAICIFIDLYFLSDSEFWLFYIQGQLAYFSPSNLDISFSDALDSSKGLARKVLASSTLFLILGSSTLLRDLQDILIFLSTLFFLMAQVITQLIILRLCLLIQFKTNIMKPIVIVYICMCLTSLLMPLNAQVSFTVASSTVSPNTARSTSSKYTIQLNAITTFSTNFDISVTFPSAFTLSSLTSCQLSINGNTVSSAACTLTSTSNLVTFNNINNAATINNLTLVFNTGTALYAGTFVASLNYYQPGTASTSYGSNSAPITISNAAMTCTFTSTSTVVGATANFTLTYSPSVFISSSSILQVQFSPWSAYTLTNFPSFSSSSVCSSSCTIRSPNTAQGFFSQILTYSSLYSSSSTSNMSLTMFNGRNPASTQPTTITATLLHYISAASQPSYMTCSSTLTASTPNQFTGSTFTPLSYGISATNSISLILNLANPISSISYLSVSYSSDLSISFSYLASNQATSPKVFPSSSSNTFLIGNLTNSTSSFSTLFLLSFSFTNAPYGNYPVSVTFTTMNLVGTLYYSIDTTTLSYVFNTSNITSASVSALSYSIGVVTNLTFTFTSINSLIANSKIILVLPSQILSTGSSSCLCSISSTCVLLNSTSFLININSVVVNGGTSFVISLNNIQNPATTTPTSSFSLTTYYYNTSTPTDVLTASVTLTATPVTLYSASAASSSLVVAANSTYTITFQNTNALPSGSTFAVAFPTQFPNSVGASLGSFTIGGFAQSSCTMSVVSTMQFQFNSCISSTAAAQSTFVITINNIINPSSTKPTSSFSIQTYFNSLLMEYMSSGVTITLTTPTSLFSSAISVLSSSVNSVTTYNFTLTFSQTHHSGDRIIITFPSLILLNSGFICTSATTGVTISCFQSSVSVLALTMTSSSTVPSTVTWSISNMQNSWYATTSSITFETTTNDTIFYYMEKGAATVTMQPVSLNVAYTPNNQLVLLSSSLLNIVLTNTFTVNAPTPALLQITITLPTELTLTATTCTTSISATCTRNIGSNQIVLTQLTTFTNTINVTFSANAGYFSTSSPFSFYLTYSNSTVSFNTAFTVNNYCQSPCKNCTSVNTQCTSCLSTPYTALNNYFAGNNSCLSSCPQTYFVGVNSTICQSCNASACLNCVTTANTCTSCSDPYFLTGTTCVTTCPNTYYGTNNLCVVCINQCYNCTNATFCLACTSGYSLNPDNTCKTTCPSGYAPQSSVCKTCTSNCLTCTTSTSTCSSCTGIYFLSATSCLITCPSTFYGNNNVCVNCINQCYNCSSATYCLSCINTYSLNPNNTCALTCPSGYVSVSSICVLCTSNCLTCTSTPSNCTSCGGLYFLSGSSCVQTCPNTFYGSNNLCVDCINQCYNCTNATYCLSCVSSFSLNPDNTCKTTCPTGYASQNSVCKLCTANCLTCTSSTSTCSSCGTPYFLSGTTCGTTCPNTYYGNGTLCVVCVNQCYNCTNSTYCLSCVSSFTLNPNHTCTSNCPSGYVEVSSVCTLCTSNCLTCITNTSTCTSCVNTYFLSGSLCTQTCPNTFFGNNSLCIPCINNCYNCTSATYCLSCATSFTLNPNHTCASTCPSGYVSVSSVCVVCTSNCLTCANTQSNCTSCANPYFLSGSSCVQNCPNTFYGANNLCVSCINQCNLCNNATYCLSCKSGSSLNPDNTCKVTCPSGYVSISSICTSCTANCLTCTSTTSTCTSCSTGYIFYNSSCVLACPQGQYQDSNKACQLCISPCKYCTTSTLCTQCLSSFYQFNTTQCLSVCPAGTFAFTTYCQSCSSSCQTCDNTATNCTSCYSGKLFYLNSCYDTCPTPTYPYQGKCTICVQPCATCLNSALLCSSCITGYVLLNATCLLSCPSTGYITMNGSCVSCPANCVSCQSSISCQICSSSYYLFQGSCLVSCPSTSPIVVNQTCNGCSSQCATCSGSPDNCVTCTLYYYKYSYTCVQSCPLTYYSNSMTYTCESGLSSKIVFFPVLITYFIIAMVIIVFKIFAKSTSVPTVVAAFSGWLQIIIAVYLLSLMSETYLQLGLNYAFPQAMIAVALIFTAAINIVHFRVNFKRLNEDEYVRKWQTVNVNYTYLVTFRYISLFTHAKFFRIIYSKMLNSLHFSMVARHFRNIFTASTAVTIAFLLLCEVPILIAAFYLAYNKLLKDQIFYTSVECLLVVIVSVVISVMDIHKPEDYFEDTQFMSTKRYLQKVNNDSLNKLEDQFRDRDEGSMDGQKCVGTSGGKFIFSRRDPNSINQILLEEGSAATVAFESKTKPNKLIFQQEKDINNSEQKSDQSPRSSRSPRSLRSKETLRFEMDPRSKINIFQPIQQEEAEYYQVLKYDEEQFKTALKMEEEQAEIQSQEEGQMEIDRKEQFGTNDMPDNSDNRSMLEYRERKQQWNQIIQHRQKLASHIFNTIDTKQLYQELEKIQQPLDEDEYQQQQKEQNMKVRQRKINMQAEKIKNQRSNRLRDLPIEEPNDEREKEKKRKRRKGKKRTGNKQLEQIYLQRLAEKVENKKKPYYAASQNFKYEF